MSDVPDYYDANKRLAEEKRKVEAERDRYREALESMLSHVCDGGGVRPCSQMWFQDMAADALGLAEIPLATAQLKKSTPQLQEAQAAMAMLADKSKDWQAGWWTGRRQASTAQAVDYCEHTFVNTVACAWCGVRQSDIQKAGDHE